MNLITSGYGSGFVITAGFGSDGGGGPGEPLPDVVFLIGSAKLAKRVRRTGTNVYIVLEAGELDLGN